MRRFWGSGDSTSKRVLNVLEFSYLRLWKTIVERVAAVEFRMNNRSDDSSGGFKVETRTNNAIGS